MVQSIQLLRNIGLFDNVAAGGQLPFSKITLVYAENGRGKTTLASVLRSLKSGLAAPILERQRLTSRHPPHVVVDLDGGAPAIFQQGAWSRTQPHLAVFDDTFVSENVCSGIEVATQHRQNLHELIVGAQGVALHHTLQGHVARIEEHNRELRVKAEAVPTGRRGGLDVDAFCTLQPAADLARTLDEAEKRLAAVRSSAAIASAATFPILSLPAIEVPEIDHVLGRDLPSLEAAAAQQVQGHLARLGPGGEAWIGEGVHLAGLLEAQGQADCPFCAQNLSGSALIDHYRGYFSANYKGLKEDVSCAGRAFTAAHGGDVPAAFERSVREAVERREFWQAFAAVPTLAIDTARIARAWKMARESVLAALRAKQAAPLEASALGQDAIDAIAAYEVERATLELTVTELAAANAALDLVKEQARAANLGALTADLTRLRAVEARFEDAISARCNEYIAEKAAKQATEQARNVARTALDQYRQNVFPSYSNAINSFLQRFNAGFRIGPVAPVNNRGGSAASYTVLIDNVAVDLTGDAGTPSFRNTLSSGDRNTLALAFFFATLDRDPDLGRTVVVIDDPMTSLDEHRTLHTHHELERLARASDRMIVLSHSKPFLLGVWEQCRQLQKTAIQVNRAAIGSTLTAWDVTGDLVTQHDRRHAAALAYLQQADPGTERRVAESLRPMLEAFVRVSYPANFAPGGKLGQFHEVCARRIGTADEIMTEPDTREFRAILDFANRYHHDENAAYETEIINDTQLIDFTRRTLAFMKRPRT